MSAIRKSQWISGAISKIRSRYLRFSISEDGHQLSIDTHIIGTVLALSPVADIVNNLPDPTEITNRLLEVITTWEAWVEDSFSKHKFVKLYEQEAVHSLLANVRRDIYDSEFKEWAEVSRGRSHLSPISDSSQDMNRRMELRSIERSLFPRLHRCQIFLTDRVQRGPWDPDRSYEMGSVAADCNVVVGDQLCQIPGCVTEFIIRKTSGQNYWLITPCYSAGLTWQTGMESYWNNTPLERITLV